MDSFSSLPSGGPLDRGIDDDSRDFERPLQIQSDLDQGKMDFPHPNHSHLVHPYRTSHRSG